RRHHHDDPVGPQDLRPGVRGHEPARRRRRRGRCPRVADVSVCVRPTSCERRSGGGRRDVPEHPHDGRDRGDAPLHGETLKLRLRRIVIHVFAWALAIAWLFPFVGLLMASFRPIPEIIGGWWNFGQFSPTLDKFGSAFSKIGTGLGNSVLIAVPGTLIPMFVATLAGYGFARFSFPVRQLMWVWNAFFFAVLLCPATVSCMPATVALIRTIGRFEFHPGLLAAGSVLVMLVPVAMYAVLQRYYIRGMVGWTIKG